MKRKITLVCSLVVMGSLAIGCGADQMDLTNLTDADSSAVRNNDDFCQEDGINCDEGKPERVPVCKAQGTRGEGWYWADTNEVIKYELCSRDTEPDCAMIGTRSEGWYSDYGLITWDQCHAKVRVSLYGEACGGSIGFTCFEDHDLYCQGMPMGTGLVGGTGTCRAIGFCEVSEDCMVEGNRWERPACEGYARCIEHSCNWVCSELEPTAWSWTTVLSDEAESEHPYASYTDQTWTVTREGAVKMKLNLTIDTEYGYDWVIVWGDGEEAAQWLSGNLEDVWTEEFEGNTLHVSLYSDHSIENWGVKVEAVSYYERLPQGSCNVSEDCSGGTSCNPNHCINPFAPCYGECN